MKSLKSFIIIGLILMVVAIGSTTYIWFTIQKEIVAPAVPAQEASEAMVAQEEEEEKEGAEAAVPEVGMIVPEEGITIDSARLSPAQKAVAEKVGIDTNAMTITPEMILCSQEKLGVDRTQEIAEGSTPTALETVLLIGCL